MLDTHQSYSYPDIVSVRNTEPSSGQIFMLRVSIWDVRRATLPQGSGNEGWIGVSPRGDLYHIVAPVDAQIAKGVMACNRPTDGTPFGGYTSWLYFRCAPFDDSQASEEPARTDQVRENCANLRKFLDSYGIDSTLEAPSDPALEDSGGHADSMSPMSETGGRWDGATGQDPDQGASSGPAAGCSSCGKQWLRVGDLLRDPEVKIIAYRVVPDDFRKGTFVFSHGTHGPMNVPVGRFVRKASSARNLSASHACPGMCHHASSFKTCSAKCEGALYRRVAAKLKAGKSG